jgi:ubiquinone/menaquinone biosynthesis C-methylase UbiE
MNLEKIKENLGEKFSRDADFLDSVVGGINLAENSKILDIGTGWGFMAITLALHGYYVITGEPENAKWADWKSRAKIANVEDKITFKPFYAENLPFEDSTFDAVFLYTSLHHINNKAHAVAEILRAMKYDGYLIIIELTKKGVEAIRQRNIYHPDAINPRDFTKGFNLKEKILQSKYLNAYIYNHKYSN